MASINSWHVIGWPVSSRTLAAASRALSLLRLVFSLGGAADSVSGAVEGDASATAVAAALLRALVWNVGPPSRLGRHGPGGWEQMPPWSRFCSYASSWCVSAIVVLIGATPAVLPLRDSQLPRSPPSIQPSFPLFSRFLSIFSLLAKSTPRCEMAWIWWARRGKSLSWGRRTAPWSRPPRPIAAALPRARKRYIRKRFLP